MERVPGAQVHFGLNVLEGALRQYGRDNNGQFPTDLSQLAPYLKSPGDAKLGDPARKQFLREIAAGRTLGDHTESPGQCSAGPTRCGWHEGARSRLTGYDKI
jgi:hypothetical protein